MLKAIRRNSTGKESEGSEREKNIQLGGRLEVKGTGKKRVGWNENEEEEENMLE